MRRLLAILVAGAALLATGPLPAPACLVPVPYHCDQPPK
jgi:hypothetical protein